MTPAISQPQNVIELLQAMVRTPSVSGNESALGDYLVDLAQRWKLDVQRLPLHGQPDQILITVTADRAEASCLLFDSHMDTVSVEGMTIDPFAAELRDGRIYGRGSCDTKGTGAAMLWALRCYAEQHERPNRIALLFSVDEEVAMAGIRAFVRDDLPRLDLKPAAVIVGEPTDMHPIIAHHGLVRWRITTRGIAAHSATPSAGYSAISDMVRIVTAIESQYIPTVTAADPLTGPAACSVNTIRGGSSANIIPDRCVIDVDRRLTPAEDAASATVALQRILAPLQVNHECRAVVQHPPLTTRYNAAIVQQARDVLAAMNLPTMTLGVAFATHAAYFDEAAIPAVVLGPGDASPAHSKDEYVEAAQVERGVELYQRLMRAAL
ncbi:MAG: M20/M25/M40 family metallo-hydrolase [Phycisphaeraceae bacterium]|nr:M20/M25/M40 family metallo-hydrolase [Phycisphaeraceae bacterium]